MQLLLIRHALPLRVDDAGGPADPALSTTGLEQAERLAVGLAGEAIDAVWSSPMRRARETSGPLAGALGLDVTVDDDLAEFDRELSFYVPMEQIRGTDDPRWAQLVEEWSSAETEADRRAFRAKVVAAVERVVAASPGQRVAVVCHGGVINAYLSHILDIERTLFFEPDYTSVNRVLASRAGHRQLVSANETPHLGRPPGDAT